MLSGTCLLFLGSRFFLQYLPHSNGQNFFLMVLKFLGRGQWNDTEQKGVPWCFWGGITGEKAGIKITSGALSWSHGWKSQSLDGAQPHFRLHYLSAAVVMKTLKAVAPTCSRVSNPSASRWPSSGLSPNPLELQTFQCKGHSCRCPIHTDFSLHTWVAGQGCGLLDCCPLLARLCEAPLFSGPLGCHVARCTEVCVSL